MNHECCLSRRFWEGGFYLYACADGEINIAVGSEGLWRRFAPLVEIDPEDERFANNGDRVARVNELGKAMAPALRSAGVDEWIERLDEPGVPAGRVRSMDEVYSSPQVKHLGLVDVAVHPTLGEIRLPGSPLSYGRSGRLPAEAPPCWASTTRRSSTSLRTEGRSTAPASTLNLLPGRCLATRDSQVYLRLGHYHIRLLVGFRIPRPSEELTWTRLASSALHDSRRP
jgi:crotonobetainyl-CoA:carnitine CoA-transferase CaiB-like acyl-CoA transferase